MVDDGTGEATEQFAEFVRRDSIVGLRVSAGTYGAVLAMLQQLEDELTKAIRTIDPTEPERQAYKLRRLEALLDESQTLIRQWYGRVDTFHHRESRAFAELTNTRTVRALNGSIASIGEKYNTLGLSDARLSALVNQPIVGGNTITDLWGKEAFDYRKQFNAQMRVGMSMGESNQKLVRRLRGGKVDGVYQSGLGDTFDQHAKTIVRSTTNAVSNQTREAIYDRNADIVEANVHIATLDSRTTLQCAARDSKQWDFETKKPIGHSIPYQVPPIHPNCRSVMGIRLIGAPMEYEGERRARDPDGTRKLVPAGTSFEDWFESLTPSEQDDLFGSTRSRLWREDKLTLSEMLDFSGQPLSIAELQAKAA